MYGQNINNKVKPPAVTARAGADIETSADRAERWLNLCNFTNLQQKLQLLKNDPQWAVTYEQLQLDPQLLLKTYRLPESQLQRNWQTYVELVQRAGDPNTLVKDQVPSSELIRHVQVRVEEAIQQLQRRLDAFPTPSLAEDGQDQEEAQRAENQRADLREQLAYGLFNVISAYAVYDQGIDLCSPSRKHLSEDRAKFSPEQDLCQLMACVLYHTHDEVSTFWIAISVVEYYDMRQFYQRGLPGVTLYGEVLNALLETHLSELNQALLQHDITYLDFFEEWASSHFLNQMPVDLSLESLGDFLREGWPFFFRLCLSILRGLQSQILSLARTNQQKPVHLRIAPQHVAEQMLAILRFQQPRTDYKPAMATPTPHHHLGTDYSAIENFKNLNESANALSGPAAENFLDIEDEQKEFDNHFAIVDSPKKAEPKPLDRSGAKQKVSKIVVNRSRANIRSASECRQPVMGLQDGAEERRGVGGLFKKFRDMIGLSKEDAKRQAEQQVELKRIHGLLSQPRDLKVENFITDCRNTWSYLLQMVKYEWLPDFKKEALCSTASQLLNGQEVKAETMSELLCEEYLRDYVIQKDQVQELLAQKQSAALRKFLDWQRKLQEKERDLMMEKARREQQEAAKLQVEKKDSGPHTSGHSAGQEISEGTQGPLPSRKASPSRERVEARDRLKPDTPLLSCGAGHSIVQFDALNSSKNGGHGGAFGARKASYSASAFNQPRGSIQSVDAFKPPVEPNFRYSGHCGSNLGMSLNLDFASSVAGGHIAGPRQLLGASQVMGVAAGSQGVYSGGAYPVLFNEADVSMMDEMNRLLMGFGGGLAADQHDPFQRNSQRLQKSSTPTPQLPSSNFNAVDPKQQATPGSPLGAKAPLPPLGQRRNSGQTAGRAQQQARQSYGGSTKLDRDEQDDLIIGGGGIGPLPARAQGRTSVNSQNLSRVSQFGHIENISKIEARQEEGYDAFGDVSLQRCLQLGQQSFYHRNSEKYQASLQHSVIKNERPPQAQSLQEQFKLNLQKIDDGAGARREQKELRPIDEQPANSEYTPNKVALGQRPGPVTPVAVGQTPFLKSPVSDHSRTAFGNDQFNFKDTSQITTGERKNVQAMDMREWQAATDNLDSPTADGNERPERDKTKERPIDQYVSPASALKNQMAIAATPAWKHPPTPPSQKDRKALFDSQRRKLAAYQQRHNAQGTDATLMIVPDKSVSLVDKANFMSPRPKQPSGSFEQQDPLNQARITSPLALKHPVPQSTPAFARSTCAVQPHPAAENPNRGEPTPPRAPPTALHPKIQIHCMPHTNKRTYFGGNFSSNGAQTAGPAPASAKPLTTKAVTPMKLLMMGNGGHNSHGDSGRAEDERAALLVSPRQPQGTWAGAAGDARNAPATRSQAVMSGKRTNNMQRQRELEEMGSGSGRQGRQVEREEPRRNGGDRDQTPVMFNSRANPTVEQYKMSITPITAALQPPTSRREISNIVSQEGSGLRIDDEANKHFDSIDQVRCNNYEHLDPSKVERSALGNSANDSKRSLKKSLSFSKNLSKSIKNLKHEDYGAILNLQGIRHEGQLGPAAKDERPLSPMFNTAMEESSRPAAHQLELPQSPPGSAGLRVEEPVLAVDAEQSSQMPSPIRQPEVLSDDIQKAEELAIPVLVNSQPAHRQFDIEPQHNSIMSAKQQAIKEKMQKIQEMKKQQKNKLGNNSTFGGGGENQTRVSHADRTNAQNNSSKSLGLGLNASSSLIFGRGGCSSSKNNLNNTNQSQEGKLAFQLNQSKMTNRTNKSKYSAHSSSYSNKLKNKVLSNHLASKQPSLNLEHSGSPPEQYKEKQEEEDVRLGVTAGSGGALDSLAMELDPQNEPRKSLSAPKSDRKSFQRRLAAGDDQQHRFMHDCSLEQRVAVLDALAHPVAGLDLDQEIEKEMKRLTGGDPKEQIHEEDKSAEDSNKQILAAPRGSGNDMKFWFGDEQRFSGQTRGSGNDPKFKNMLGVQAKGDEGEQQDKLKVDQSSFNQEEKVEKKGSPVYEKLTPQADAAANSPKPRSHSAIDPRLKQRKVKAVQEFINNAKKNKFSEWRKLKQQNQTQSSDNQSQGQR